MNEARCACYKEFIDENSSDQSKLFRASKSLLNLQADKSLPPHTDASVLANEMGEYFIHKIVATRSSSWWHGLSCGYWAGASWFIE